MTTMKAEIGGEISKKELELMENAHEVRETHVVAGAAIATMLEIKQNNNIAATLVEHGCGCRAICVCLPEAAGSGDAFELKGPIAMEYAAQVARAGIADIKATRIALDVFVMGAIDMIQTELHGNHWPMTDECMDLMRAVNAFQNYVDKATAEKGAELKEVVSKATEDLIAGKSKAGVEMLKKLAKLGGNPMSNLRKAIEASSKSVDWGNPLLAKTEELIKEVVAKRGIITEGKVTADDAKLAAKLLLERGQMGVGYWPQPSSDPGAMSDEQRDEFARNVEGVSLAVFGKSGEVPVPIGVFGFDGALVELVDAADKALAEATESTPKTSLMLATMRNFGERLKKDGKLKGWRDLQDRYQASIAETMRKAMANSRSEAPTLDDSVPEGAVRH